MKKYELILDLYNEMPHINAICAKYVCGLGTNVILVKKDDAEDIEINISINTPVNNNKGISHIVEHCVSNELYKLKKDHDLYYQKQSTYIDKTLYKFGFHQSNTKYIYDILNAIFNSQIDELDFMRQGWRYEFNDKTGKLIINGVVYNEMKDVFNSPIASITKYIPSSLYKNSHYGYISGGIPDEIISLEYKEADLYYKEFYNINNSTIIVIGNFDLNVMRNYFQKIILKIYENNPKSYEKKGIKVEVQRNDLQMAYQAFNKKDLMDKYFISVNFSVKKPEDIFEYGIYNIIQSYFNKNKINSKEYNVKNLKVITKFNNGMPKPYFSFIMAGNDIINRDLMLKLIKEEMIKLTKHCMNKIFEEDIISKGNCNLSKLEFCNRILEATLYGLNSFAYLVDFKEKYENSESFLSTQISSFICRNFIENKNYSFIVLIPEKGLIYRKEQDLNRKLSEKLSSITKEEFQKIKDIKKELLKEDNTLVNFHNSRDLSFSKCDDRFSTDNYCLDKQNINSITVYNYYSDIDNNNYINFYFDLSKINPKYIKYITLLSLILFDIPEVEHYIKRNKMEIFCYMLPLINPKDNIFINSKFVIKGSSDKNKKEEIFKFVSDLKKIVDLKKNSSIIGEILREVKNNFEDNIHVKVHKTIVSRITAYFSVEGYENDNIEGILFYKFIDRICKNYDEMQQDVIENLEYVFEYLFNSNNLTISVYSNNSEEMSCIIDKYYNSKIKRDLRDSYKLDKLIPKNEGIIIPSNVNYVIQGFDFSILGYEYDGATRCNMKSIA
ncbi:hypothetical protein [Pseudobacteroides cellulosolvens]|uniref:Peptidase M16C associated domain protein n=1 Tax=Pseudobacteroides cellulosolvens ATCC 35603 = DSM 2933 TaxID=398512 RepID=A0A0L6JSV7_9FIRM|nr:hypothetical protein [Pseudobacteroides cellulosolvens]KNY28931.1 Peptidase M16C associated domain protein [Pseudobacteroides cellulosolvens ATCC 35603 = DSM 2933]